jgi:hypothetical protein
VVANVQTMAYHGDVPWRGIGTPVPMGLTGRGLGRSTRAGVHGCGTENRRDIETEEAWR